jgi:hypothetical protein
MSLFTDNTYISISKWPKIQRKEVFLSLETDADIIVDPGLIGSGTFWFLSNPDS